MSCAYHAVNVYIDAVLNELYFQLLFNKPSSLIFPSYLSYFDASYNCGTLIRPTRSEENGCQNGSNEQN